MTPEEKLEAVRFPIGRFTIDPEVTESKRRLWIRHIAALPANLRAAVGGLSEAQLDRSYRPGGWTARQVVHHLADEHVNAFTYFKMALTEGEPVIKTYDEPRWAETEDMQAIEPRLRTYAVRMQDKRETIAIGRQALAIALRMPEMQNGCRITCALVLNACMQQAHDQVGIFETPSRIFFV